MAATTNGGEASDDDPQMMDSSPDQQTAAAAVGSSDSGGGGSIGSEKIKNYKTTLCQYYLQGPCKNADKCNYAHGTSELRTSTGLPVSELENAAEGSVSGSSALNRFKTTLCVKFVTNGSCPFGMACNFAHGVQELRQAAEHVQRLESGSSHNANYKTTLCKKYSQGLYCPFAEKCQYAHGRAELREKPASIAPSMMTEDDKKKRIEKAKKMPGYKTKVCQNFEKSGECEYGEICHYAHGKDEIRDATAEDKETLQQGNPFYKTAMCKNLKKGECVHGDQCIYAHDEAELRPPPQTSNKNLSFKTTLCKNFTETGFCSFGITCQFAHGPVELRCPPQALPLPGPHMGMPRMAGPNKYKTQMCTQMMNQGSCPRGVGCSYAHSRTEQRPLQSRQLGVVQKPGQPLKYKTTMCTTVMEANGVCLRGEECHFAHSVMELKAAQAADPKFKTELCTNFATHGFCERQNNCKFAHGQGELRPVKMPNAVTPTYNKKNPTPPGPVGQVKQDNYKTTMCRHAVNGICQRGEACNFAHSAEELRFKIVGAGGSKASEWGFGNGHHFDSGFLNGSGQVPPFRAAAYSGSDFFSNNSYGSNGKRKKLAPGGNVKTVLCPNFSTFGQCQFGDTCHYAHGETELTVNKRQRF